MSTIECRRGGSWETYTFGQLPDSRLVAELRDDPKFRIVPDGDAADWANWLMPQTFTPGFDADVAREAGRLYDEQGPGPAVAYVRAAGYGRWRPGYQPGRWA